MRLGREVEDGKRDGVFRKYPFLDTRGEPTWKGKFPTLEAVTEQQRKMVDDVDWQREYLLNIVRGEDQVVPLEWIRYYDKLPSDLYFYRTVYIGVDLAISEATTADYTAMVSVLIYGFGDDFGLYILPHPTNKRLDFPDTVEQIKELYYEAYELKGPVEIYVEQVGYQKAVIDQLSASGFPVEGVPITSDKRARLAVASSLIKSGHVHFPRTGAEELIQQIVGFGREHHDDLVDAFTLAINQASGVNRELLRVYRI